LPYPPGELLHCITTEKQTYLWVTFSFEATFPLKLLFILRHYAAKNSKKFPQTSKQGDFS
jgi:hypothetical protein